MNEGRNNNGLHGRLENGSSELSEKTESGYLIDEMAYRYYKNYYSYEMDHDFAVMDAVEELF